MSSEPIRQLEDTGRVVIPKEVREVLGLDGKSLAIEREDDGKGIGVFVAKDNGSYEYEKVLDDEGRFIIPAELRKQLGWEDVNQVEFVVKNKRVIIREHLPQCAICGAREMLLGVKQGYVCEECLGLGNDRTVDEWALLLDKVMNQYTTYCEQSLSFEDMEDVHQARVKGRRMSALLKFLRVPASHPVLERIKQAHKQLGKVRELDVFIHEFSKAAEREKNGHAYQSFAEAAQKQRKKPRKKLAKNLPGIINEEFSTDWERFLQEELRGYVLAIDIGERLDEYEQVFESLVKEYEKVIEKEGRHTKRAMKALHAVRIESKKLRYTYHYLNKLKDKNYKKKAKYYKRFQRKFGKINDLRDWLKQLDNLQKEVDLSKKEIKKVRKQLQKDMNEQVEQVELG
ncbi:CHAD domain-containing protein [Bacillus tianshenii]|nr:CHAD domain-containing protein [Bacillus tianshenii]